MTDHTRIGRPAYEVIQSALTVSIALLFLQAIIIIREHTLVTSVGLGTASACWVFSMCCVRSFRREVRGRATG